MSLAMWTMFLFALAVALLLAELALPTHGLLGFLALLVTAGAVFNCYRINMWLGTGVFIGGLVATPFAWAAFIKLWPKTPIGRRIILPKPQAGPVQTCAIQVGDVGTSVSGLRPIGICEFGAARVEAVSEYGIIEENTAVQVVAIHHNRPTVRAVPNAVSGSTGKAGSL